MTVERNTRNLLGALGIGQFNTTMMIQYMFMAPATTDPKSPQIMLMVAAIQDQLNSMGAGLDRTGYLDVATANALDNAVGPDWEKGTWSGLIANVLALKKSGAGIAAAQDTLLPVASENTAMSGITDASNLGLPDVPGGLITYGVVAYLLYRHFTKKS